MMTSETDADPKFRKVLLRRDVLALAVGAMVGFSWIIYASSWSAEGGTFGAILGFVAVGVMSTFIGLAYSELTSIFPRTAGEVVFAYRAIGENTAWFVGWFMLSAYALVAFFEAVFFPFLLVQVGIPIPQIGALWTIGGQTVYLSWALVSFAGIAFFAGLNYRGINFSGAAQTIGVFVLVAVGIFIALMGVGAGSSANAQPFITDFDGISTVLFLAPAFLLGFGTIPQVSEELDISREASGKLIPVAIWLAIIFYSIVILGIGFGAPLSARSEGLGIASAIISLTESQLTASIVLAGGLAGMLTSWNAFFLASSRVVYGLGRAEMLPEWFAGFDDEHGVPVNAIHTMVAISVVSVLVGYGIINQLLNSVSFYIVLLWAIVFVSFILLRTNEPKIERPFKVPYFRTISALGILALMFFFANYTPFSPSGGLGLTEWSMIGGYFALGIVVWGGWFKRKATLTDEERLSRLTGSDNS